MLITADVGLTRQLPYPRAHVWDVMTAHPTEEASLRWVEGPRYGEVGCTHLLHLPAAAPDGLPAVYLTTLTHVSPGHMYQSVITGPLLEQREVWSLRTEPDLTVVTATAWVRASGFVYEAEALRERTTIMLRNTLAALTEQCRARPAA